MLKSFIFIVCLVLSACMVGPNYKEPPKQVAAHWAKKDKSVKETRFKDTKWWHEFHDPVLIALIKRSYHDNLSVQAAGVKVLQARAQLAQSVGQLYPQQQLLTGSATYTRIGGTSLQQVLPSEYATDLFGAAANWEIDFWGKYRRAIQANDAAFLSSLAAYDNALVSLTADTATTYIKLRTYQEQYKITLANIQIQRIGLKIARARFNSGQTSLVDVEQASTELSQTEASLPSIVVNIQKQKDALAVLLGTIPNNVDALLKPSHGIPKAPSSVAVGIPKEAMARRPDVHQARLDAVGQSAAIGAAKANLFPSFSLNGAFAFAANNIGGSSLGDLFNWSNRNIVTGAGFNWPILNYGQITNAVRAQDAVFQQALLNYMNVVLKAQQEVQDNITAYIEAKKATAALAKANTSAIKSFKLALIRYREGETDFTPVLNAEQQLLSVQNSYVNAQGDIPMALVALYRALGGGWEIRNGDDVVSQQVKAEMAARTNWGTLLKQQNHQPPATRAQKIKQLYLPKW